MSTFSLCFCHTLLSMTVLGDMGLSIIHLIQLLHRVSLSQSQILVLKFGCHLCVNNSVYRHLL